MQRCVKGVYSERLVSSGYRAEWRAAYLLHIRGALIRGIRMDDRRNVVGMRMNVVATQTADALGEREHGNIGEGHEREPTCSSRGDSGGRNH